VYYRPEKEYIPVPERGIHAGEVYYVSKNALCSRSIAHEQLKIQPIAVSKVMLRPVIHQIQRGQLEVLEDSLVNDIAFLDRNVTGKEAELNSPACPIHSIPVLFDRRPSQDFSVSRHMQPLSSLFFQDQMDLLYLSIKILSPQNWGIQYRFGVSGRFLLSNGRSITEFLRPPYPTNCEILNSTKCGCRDGNYLPASSFNLTDDIVDGEPATYSLVEGRDKRTYFLRAIQYVETSTNTPRIQKMNRRRKEVPVFVYINKDNNMHRGIEIVWLV
jgi:hypothetical protein